MEQRLWQWRGTVFSGFKELKIGPIQDRAGRRSFLGHHSRLVDVPDAGVWPAVVSFCITFFVSCPAGGMSLTQLRLA
jgi:hypothetical protein